MSCGGDSGLYWESAFLLVDRRAPVPNWGKEGRCRCSNGHLENQCPSAAGLAVFVPMLAVLYHSGATNPPAFRFNVCSFNNFVVLVFVTLTSYFYGRKKKPDLCQLWSTHLIFFKAFFFFLPTNYGKSSWKPAVLTGSCSACGSSSPPCPGIRCHPERGW